MELRYFGTSVPLIYIEEYVEPYQPSLEVWNPSYMNEKKKTANQTS